MKDKITQQDIDNNIDSIEIVKYVTNSGKILRWAVLNTKSGYAVTGRPSATINAENDNPELGDQIAINNSKNEMWPLMGYHLSQEIYKDKMNNVVHNNITIDFVSGLINSKEVK